MAQSHYAKKGPCENSQMVRLGVFLTTCSQCDGLCYTVYISIILPTAMNTLKSWQWMESCSSSDREKDRSTQRSDCCINVRSSHAGCVYMSFSHTDEKFPFFFFIDPFILPHQQVDKGAIKFVLSGANIMCPGLTSPGAKLYPAEADTVVVSFCTWYSTRKRFDVRAIKYVKFTIKIVLLPHFKPSICKFVFNKWMQAIMAEGKSHALCVGVMKMSAESM